MASVRARIGEGGGGGGRRGQVGRRLLFESVGERGTWRLDLRQV